MVQLFHLLKIRKKNIKTIFVFAKSKMWHIKLGFKQTRSGTPSSHFQ